MSLIPIFVYPIIEGLAFTLDDVAKVKKENKKLKEKIKTL